MQRHGWLLAAGWFLLMSGTVEIPAAPIAPPQAGSPYAIDVWDADDGLPQNSVISMTQTRDGYLWLGTVNGLGRFDGLRFTVFDENNTPGLSSSPIASLFEDSGGGLWIATESAGVILAKDGTVANLGIVRGSGEGRRTAICEDATGAVWIFTADGQLWRYHQGITNLFLPGGDRSGNYRTIIPDGAGNLLVGTDGRIFSFNAKTDPVKRELTVEWAVPVRNLDYLLPSKDGGYWRLAGGTIQKCRRDTVERDFGSYPWTYAKVWSACEDRDGNLLVGTLGEGVFVFDAKGKSPPVPISTAQGLSSSFILSLRVDREGTLWVGTDGGGLNRVRRPVFRLLEETRDLTVRSVCEDATGGLWMSFNAIDFNANGAGYWKDSVFQGYGRAQGLMNSSVWSIFADQKQQVWAGTYGGLFQLQNGRFGGVAGMESFHPVILAMHQDRQGRKWLGTQGGLVRGDERGWTNFTTRHGLSADEVRAIADDREGNLWVGTRGGGLNRFRDGQFTSLRKAEELPSEDISSLLVDEDGVLWVGTFGSGLARFSHGRWTRYTRRDGLISNSVGYIVEDGQGYLWIGSNAGLMRARKSELNEFAAGGRSFVLVNAYKKADGLPTSECTLGSQPGACRTRDGRLWFPTIKGLVSVDPTQLLPNTNPPPVLVESVLIEGREEHADGVRSRPVQVMKVPAGEGRIEVHYTSLNLSAGSKARFRYRMEGHETDWTEAGAERVARYRKLPAGDYRFHVTACNEDGVWNPQGSSFALTVLPPFWSTWWFLTLVVASVLGAVVGVVHYLSTQKLHRQLESLRQKEALEKERSRIARDIHDQLGANLTQVSLLGELVESDKDLPEEVELHAKQIRQTALETQRALDEIVWTVNPSNDTLEGLINYVCKYAQDYLGVAGLKYRLDVPAELPAASITPEVRHNVYLASREAVTNVVRHAQATSVWVRLKLEPGRFTLEIQDDGRGPSGAGEKRAQSRNGLRNMSRRMEDVGGSFELGPAPERGTLVRLTAPLGKL